jgi:hypothetical protein
MICERACELRGDGVEMDKYKKKRRVLSRSHDISHVACIPLYQFFTVYYMAASITIAHGYGRANLPVRIPPYTAHRTHIRLYLLSHPTYVLHPETAKRSSTLLPSTPRLFCRKKRRIP